ncbi:MAG: bacterioferritin, partial [Francisella sp.]
MEHKQKVIDYLNMLLADEFLAQNQYLIHSEMYLDWG